MWSANVVSFYLNVAVPACLLYRLSTQLLPLSGTYFILGSRGHTPKYDCAKADQSVITVALESSMMQYSHYT